MGLVRPYLFTDKQLNFFSSSLIFKLACSCIPMSWSVKGAIETKNLLHQQDALFLPSSLVLAPGTMFFYL